MKLSELKRAYDITNPTQAQKDKMLEAILAEAPGPYTRKVEYKAKPAKHWRWSWIPAAAVLALVVAMGMFVLSREAGQISFSNTPRIESRSLIDFLRSDFYNASMEWYGYVTKYVTDNNIEQSHGSGYHCYNEEMTAALNALCEEYGLSLYYSNEHVGVDSYDVLLDAVGISGLFRNMDGVKHGVGKEWVYRYYPDGDFNFNGLTTMFADSPRVYRIGYSYYKAAGDKLHPAFWKLGPIENYDYWEYTTQAGQELLLAIGEDGALILMSRDEDVVFIEVTDYQVGDVTLGVRDMDKAALEAFAETFDFSLTPAVEEDSDIMESIPEDYLFILQKYQTAADENWKQEDYDQNDISRMAMFLKNPANLGYCLMDLDGNGYEELLVGVDDMIYDLFTYSEENGVMHILSAGEKNYSLHENGIIQTWLFTEQSTTWLFYELRDGFNMTINQAVVFEDGVYYAGPNEADVQPVEKDRAGDILASYQKQQIDYIHFITENAPSEEAETLDPAYALKLEHYVKAVEEDWTPERCGQELISYLARSLNSVDEIGYTLIDLDWDGTEELIISDGKVIYDLYTIVEDEVRGPLWVCSSGERLVYTLGEDHSILFRGSSGAANTEYSIWSFVKDQLVAEHILLYDADIDPKNPWFYKNEPKATEYPIPEDEANTILELFADVPIETRDILRGTVKDNRGENAASTLFETMFVPTVEGTIGNDLESFSTALGQNGYSSYEEEGILYVDDPENTGSYLYGVLTNESGTVEIAQLGYCYGTKEEKREVHVILFDDGTKYYLDIPSGEGMEVQQVQSLEELREYLLQQETQPQENPYKHNSYAELIAYISQHEENFLLSVGDQYADFAETCSYALLDVTGDGEEELILGRDGQVTSIWYMVDGKTSGEWGSDEMYICEGGIREQYIFRDDEPEHYYSVIGTEGEKKIYVGYDSHEKSWMYRDFAVDTEPKPISEEDAMKIINSYVRVEFDWKPISEFPMN